MKSLVEEGTVLDSFSLAGRRALVTGGSGGLGAAMAAALAGAGAEVAIVGRSERTDEVAAALSRPGHPVASIRADVTDRSQLSRGFEDAVEQLGGLHVLVCAHGHLHPAPALEHELEAWDLSIETNLTSVFELARLAARQMSEGGKIINVASMLSFSGGLNAAAYAAGKGGVAQLTKALANEWAPLGINVNAIAPGYIKTDLNRHIWEDDPARAEQVLARLPAGRWGEPGDLAGATVFLASAASDYLHGTVLPVDGGYLSR